MKNLSTYEMSSIVFNIRKHSTEYLKSHNIKAVVIGVSGGIDSALVCALLKPVCSSLNIPLVGRSITIESNKMDEISRANYIGKSFCTDFEGVDLSNIYQINKEIDGMEFVSDTNSIRYKIRMGNIKARMRMIYLYNMASALNGLVLSTDNLTEYYLGFWTLHGDVGDFGPIQQLWKTEVYQIAQCLCDTELSKDENARNALLSCINCNATDGLGITNTDLDQIMPDWRERHNNTRDGYEEVDDILIEDFSSLNHVPSKVIERYHASNFKRENPYNISRDDIFSNKS